MRITRDQAFDVRDVVATDFSGRVTQHVILERYVTRNSQSGVLYRVAPPVPKSGGPDAKIDHAWFTRVGRMEIGSR